MFRDFLKNPFTVLHAISVTMLLSFWTILQLNFSKVPRDKLDNRLRWWAKTLINFIDLKYTVNNPHDFVPENGKPYIVMCNHCSHYDIPLSLVALKGSIRMMAKKELLRIPLWGRAMQLTGFVSIDRFNPRQALKDMNYAKKMMERGIILWIAPEGTRSKTGKLQKLKPGGFRLAIQSGAVIIPMAIKGSNEVMAAKSLQVSRNRNVAITIGNPIDASTYKKSQRDDLMHAFEQEIQGMLADE